MGVFDGLDEVRLVEEHLPGAVALVEAAGWNQTEDDWRLMIRHGHAIGLTEGERLVATGLALPYPDGGFAWISMILVAPDRRRRGLATRMMQACMAHIRELGLTPVLDATPAGEAVYRQLGFVPVCRITRWRGVPRLGFICPEAGAIQMHFEDLENGAALDRAAFGADRGFVREDLFRRGSQWAFRGASSGPGCVLARSGRTAVQIGPLVADSDDTVTALLVAAAVSHGTDTILIDVPDAQAKTSDLMALMGLRPERPYTRMTWPERREFGDMRLVHAIAGPELG